MTQKKNLSAKSRGKSFAYAFNGLAQLIKQEPNARIHAIVTIAVIIAGFAKHINRWQWVALFFAIGLVWITEALNTCIEELCNFSCENKWHPAIKTIKDISAAAVLIAAIVSVGVGIIVFFC